MNDKIIIKRACWKGDEIFMDEPVNITTLVIRQGDIYIDPSDSDFLSSVFKEFVRRKIERGSKIILELSDKELFFYNENADAYLLNYIYSYLFPGKKDDPFNSFAMDEEGTVNLGLFNVSEHQIYVTPLIRPPLLTQPHYLLTLNIPR